MFAPLCLFLHTWIQIKTTVWQKYRQGHYRCLDPLCMQMSAGLQRAMAAAFLYCFTDKFLFCIIPRLFKFLWLEHASEWTQVGPMMGYFINKGATQLGAHCIHYCEGTYTTVIRIDYVVTCYLTDIWSSSWAGCELLKIVLVCWIFNTFDQLQRICAIEIRDKVPKVFSLFSFLNRFFLLIHMKIFEIFI